MQNGMKINNNPKVIINRSICAKQGLNLRILRQWGLSPPPQTTRPFAQNGDYHMFIIIAEKKTKSCIYIMLHLLILKNSKNKRMSCMQKKMLSVMPVGLSHLIYMQMYFFCFCFLIFFWFCFFLFFIFLFFLFFCFFCFFILLWWLITLSRTRARFGSSRYCAQLFLLLLFSFYFSCCVLS